MRSTVSQTVARIDLDTRIQYGMMLLFGTLCLVAAASPLGTLTKAVVVSALFGFTGGLWVSHLVQIIQEAAASQPEGDQ
jgi:MFS superfamily sulfate permease-like transporter